MAALVRDQGIGAAVLDVAGPVAATLDHAELRALASGVSDPGAPAPPPPGRQAPLRLTAPDPPLPPAAADALGEALAPHAAVVAGYVFAGADRLWVGLDAGGSAPPDAAAEAAVDAIRALVPGTRVDCIAVEHDAVLEALRAAAPPLYERGSV
jgi:hypothetical protein